MNPQACACTVCLGSSGTPARLRVGWGVGAAREPNWKAGVGLGGSSLLSSGVYSEGTEKA